MVLGVFRKKNVDSLLLSYQLISALLCFGIFFRWQTNFRELVDVEGKLLFTEEFFFVRRRLVVEEV